MRLQTMFLLLLTLTLESKSSFAVCRFQHEVVELRYCANFGDNLRQDLHWYLAKPYSSVRFASNDLPRELTLDEATGIVSGHNLDINSVHFHLTVMCGVESDVDHIAMYRGIHCPSH